MSLQLPLWLRAVAALHSAVQAVARAAEAARDEAFIAWLTPERRRALSDSLYEERHEYAPGGATFSGGLFEWERRAIESAPFPAAGRLLVGGAGAGRETVALRDRGYEVVAFDPSERLVREGQPAVAARPGAVLLHASYDDLVRASRGNISPLLPHVRDNFDGIILGWSSLCYVTDAAERETLLRALHSLAPRAPVLLSVLPRFEDPSRARAWTSAVLRRVFRWLRAPAAWHPGLSFRAHAGLLQTFTPADIEVLASSTGYRIAHLVEEPEPHAVLVP